MNKLFGLAFILLTLSSCNKVFYQVYTMRFPTDVVKNDKSLVYENEDCKITYNLWASGGTSGFSIFNKSDVTLFVMLPQSFFVLNGYAYDYFLGRTYSTSASVFSSLNATQKKSSKITSGVYSKDILSISSNSNAISRYSTVSSTYSSATSSTEQAILAIPPRAYKNIGEYSIFSGIIKSCDNEVDYPKTMSEQATYTKSNTPAIFRNVLSYKLDNEPNTKMIDHEFWLSDLVNYSEKEAIQKVFLRGECKEIKSKAPVSFFKIETPPDKFYNPYSGKKSEKATSW